MTARTRTVVRLVMLMSLLVGNYAVRTVKAQWWCWDCKWCSDGRSCCPVGSKWATCSQGSQGATCWVTKGSCAGGGEEFGDGETDPDGDPQEGGH